MRNQARVFNTDAPSEALLMELLPILPNLVFMCLDPTHLCMNFNSATWKKTTTAERILRVIMNKFTKVDYNKPASFWGAPFMGKGAPEVTAGSACLRSYMITGSMPKTKAVECIMAIDGESPWYSVTAFTEAMAALVSVHWDTVNRPTPGVNKRLYHLMRSATDSARSQWYFNNIRARRFLPKEYIPLMPSGTCSNESLHHELNTYIHCVSSGLYTSTLELELWMISVAKLLSHNIALYNPQLRQYSQVEVIAATSRGTRPFTDVQWTEWCEPQYRLDGVPTCPRLILIEKRARTTATIAAHAKTLVKRRIVGKKTVVNSWRRLMKKPAAVMPQLRSFKKIKRSVFNLKRIYTPKE
jgi:hypothetical protein